MTTGIAQYICVFFPVFVGCIKYTCVFPVFVGGVWMTTKIAPSGSSMLSVVVGWGVWMTTGIAQYICVFFPVFVGCIDDNWNKIHVCLSSICRGCMDDN